MIYRILDKISIMAMTVFSICVSFIILKTILSLFIDIKSLVVFDKFYTWELIILLFSISLVLSLKHFGIIELSTSWKKYIK